MVKHPLDFIPMKESADERSGGRVVIWINSWQKDRTGAAWGGRTLKRFPPDDWFQLQTQDRPRLWTHTLVVMEKNGGIIQCRSLGTPHIPHVFAIPRLMTHLWRRQLYKDAQMYY